MAYDAARGVTVLFGGTTTGNDYNGETWEWNGASWALRSVTGPSPRYGHAMAYDTVRGVTVLTGGVSSSCCNNQDTWEWDGNTWTQRGTGAPALYAPAMCFDGARSVALLFGGYSSGMRRDTWTWNGSTWTLRGTEPPPRFGHSMAYDTARHVSVLFGGSNAGSPNLADTWEWNGTAFVLRETGGNGGPSARYFHALSYDQARALTVLFGGTSSAGGLLAETWVWDGSAWQQRAIPGPTARESHAMAYDASRNETVLFGGYSTSSWSGETWVLGRCGPRITSQPTSVELTPCQTATFTVEAISTSPMTYRWRRNGVNLNNNARISGVTTPTLTIHPAGFFLAGDFDVLVTTDCGTVPSQAAMLLLRDPADFNGDGDSGTDQDIEAFFACLGGTCCPTCDPAGSDFNGDGDFGTDQDIESFFRVLGGGTC